jgi:hypothetical protein
MLTKIVAKKKNGTLIKGTTGNFLPNRNMFHVNLDGAADAVSEVLVDDLKAIFFVKSFEGISRPHIRVQGNSSADRKSIERKIRVTFMDNEVIEGYSHSFHLDRLGFFMTPADPNSNNARIFVLLSSVKSVFVDGKAIDLTAGSQTERVCEQCGKKLEPGWKYCPFDGAKI